MHDEKVIHNKLSDIFIKNNKVIRNYNNIYENLDTELKDYIDN